MLIHAVLALPVAAKIALLALFVGGGVVKDVIGIGLPLTVIPLATLFLDVPVAIGLLSVPMVATNIGQALEGGRTAQALRQLWPLLAALILGTLIGVHLLISVNKRLLSGILGVAFIGLAGLLLSMPRVTLSPRIDRWAAPLVGFSAGVIGGISAMFGPPMIAYLIGRRTDPNTFVKHMAILAFTASLTLLLALGGSRTMALGDLLVSAAAIVPIQLGMPAGRWLRHRIKPEMFRRGVLVVLTCSGVDMLRRALL